MNQTSRIQTTVPEALRFRSRFFNVSCFMFNVHMHEVTPSAVAMADSTLMAV